MSPRGFSATALFFAVLAAAACSPRPPRPFPVGFLAPVSPRVAAEARRLGLEITPQAPQGAEVVAAARKVKDGEVMQDWARLRCEAAGAAARGASGLFFRLPSAPAGHDLLEYVEEWQALGRVLREILLMRPILQRGETIPAPFAASSGVDRRAWSYEGRSYALLVNSSGAPVPLRENELLPWRALFFVRADAREALAACGREFCLPPEGVLWLEGRVLPERRP
ncbi:MAG: hypothetical protein ACHQ49_07815 [Elusimicrobiota bacterium]